MKCIISLLIINLTLCLAQTEIKADTIINSGWIIAYGQLLSKPYKLSMINDTIYINNIRVEPPISKPTTIPEGCDTSLQLTALGEMVWPKSDSFEVNCRSLWAEWMKNADNDTAKVRQMLAAYIDTQQLVKIKDYNIDAYVSVTFDYRRGELFKNVPKGQYRVDTMFWNYSFYLYIPYPHEHPDEEEVLLKAKKHAQFCFKFIKGTLKHNALYFRNHVLEMTRRPGQADSIVAAIKEVINSQVADSLKVKKISKILRISDDFAMEILKNSDSWKDIEK